MDKNKPTREEALEMFRGGEAGIRQWNKLNENPQLIDLPSFHEADISGLDMSGANLNNCKFTEATAIGTVLAKTKGTDLVKATVDGAASFSGATLTDATLSGIDFTHCDLAGAILHKVTANDCRFGHKLDGAEFHDAKNLNRTIFDFSRQEIHVSFKRADFSGAQISGVALGHVDFSGAKMYRATLQSLDFSKVKLLGVKGFFDSKTPVFGSGNVNQEDAVVKSYRLSPPWSLCRAIGSMRLFAVSYAAIIAIILYAMAARFYNGHVDEWQAWATEHGEGPVEAWSSLLLRLPRVDLPRHVAVQMGFLGLLAIGATLFAVRCPNTIKEATETHWTRGLRQQLIEYRVADFSRPLSRYACSVFFGLGVIWTLGYLLFRACGALIYLWVG